MMILLKILVLGCVASAAPVKVYFLPQIHSDGRNRYRREVSYSQFWILRELLKIDQPTIFQEGYITDFSTRISDLSIEDQAELGEADVRTLFSPEVMQNHFANLSDGQKSLLSGFSGSQISVMMGNGLIRTTENQQLNDSAEIYFASFFGLLKSFFFLKSYNNLVFTQREDFAVQKIAKFVESEHFHGEPIILVYGRDHDFTRAFKAHPELELVTITPNCNIDLGGAALNRDL